jgi:hypothetical protein
MIFKLNQKYSSLFPKELHNLKKELYYLRIWRCEIKRCKSKNPKHFKGFRVFCDLDWIQTSNLLSRNQVRYSVAPQGLITSLIVYFHRCSVNVFAGANIGKFNNPANRKSKKYSFFSPLGICCSKWEINNLMLL